MGVSSNASTGDMLSRVTGTLLAAAKDFVREDGPQWAAAIAYYGLLSTFPLMLAAISIAAFFVNPDWAINQITQIIGQYLPQGELKIEAVVQETFAARGQVSIVSFLLLLWSGSRVFGVLTRALNIAFDQSEKYGFFKRHLVELIMMVTLGMLFILAMISRTTIRYLWNRFIGLPGGQSTIFFILQLAIPAMLLLAVFYLIYRFVPNRDVDSKAALIGALFATVAILIARPLFLGYLNRFAEYNLIYGSLAIVVILIIWIWVMATIVLFGGQIASEIQMNLPGNMRTKDRKGSDEQGH